MSDWRSNKLLFQISITILILLDISAIILNGLVAYVLKRHKKTRIITFWFIYCLSISDVMVGLMQLVSHLLQLRSFLHRTALGSLHPVVQQLSNFFFAMSGRLISTIAIDRCIHMKYLSKYTTIMTQFRARCIILLNIIFGLLLLIPSLLPPEKYFDLGVTLFHTAMTLMTCFIYIKTYFSIKRQVAALQSINSNDIVVQNKADNTNQCNSGPLTAQHCIGCMRIDTAKEIRIEKARSIKKDDNMVFESQQKAYVLPESAAISSYKSNNKSENANDIENKTHSSNAVESLIVPPVAEVIMENEAPIQIKQENKEQNLERKFLQKQQRLNPDREFRKATWLILAVLFISYFPTFLNNFYSFAGGKNIVFSSICEITVLSNSSLNAIILIAFSRELKGHIRAVFARAFGLNLPENGTNRVL